MPLGEHRARAAERLATSEAQGKLLEAQRLEQRTPFDLEMIQEIGFCSGDRELQPPPDGREPGDAAGNADRLFPR